MHIYVGNLTITGSDNGLSPGRRQAIIETNAGILLIGPRGTNFSQILIKICIFSFKKMHLKMASGKWRPLWLGLNVLRVSYVMVIVDFNISEKALSLQCCVQCTCIAILELSVYFGDRVSYSLKPGWYQDVNLVVAFYHSIFIYFIYKAYLIKCYWDYHHTSPLFVLRSGYW